MASDLTPTVDYLLSPEAIRDRSQILFELACRQQLDHFTCDLTRLPAAADYVIQVMQQQYPSGEIPVHSRWRHFEVAQTSRLDLLQPALAQLSPLERARLKVDLAVVSVLLDAGAGPTWQYREPDTGHCFSRSEGLAIASFHSFRQGVFSSDPERPWQVDGAGLRQLTPAALATAFQVSDTNPLVGLPGRVALLQQLGQVLGSASAHPPSYFDAANPRPGHLVDYWLTQARQQTLPARTLLMTLLRSLGPIWPGRIQLGGTNLGDVWYHPHLPDTGPGSTLVPFHKLSQWLTYSLLEPLQELGLTITDLDALTGLAEYRNGGLFVDMGVLVPRHGAVTGQPHLPDAPVIVEWRALTIQLLDRLATEIRAQRHQTADSLPLPKILQGGTWTAGRQLAQAQRPGGTPPIQLASDGTVF